MKSRKFRHWIELNPYCLCVRGRSSESHDYTRYGTTSLFAALNVKTGQVIGECHCRHRSIEFQKFLDTIDNAVPVDFDIHLILDNYGTHKTPMIKRWLAKRPCYHLHFTPTSASWMIQVERWFAALTEKELRAAPIGALESWNSLLNGIWKSLISI